jgi:hypothetical protein
VQADIEQVGTTVRGLQLCRFPYKIGMRRLEGEMAQDFLEVMPRCGGDETRCYGMN